ncbi:NADH dehydrogenase [ubiquinone] 1 beta subcomplex subunit 8, mitochondrial [Anabrus simplex]|uniref:NADH dehydrogenase [ubiquinone] 1 beta subcomplex subunit 8, mitochondrial n=1 Tax=Anabrus simplex TaxID=316456 RepID=UPI0034DD1064
MAAIVRVANKSVVTKYNWPVAYQVVRNHWNKDWKPGPYPKTPEEKAAAAKKYGLLPEEYEPYPDDGLGYGDYPKLPLVSGEAKDPYYPWDFPEHKRNFNEPLHAYANLIGEDRFDVSAKPRYSLLTQVLCFVGAVGGSAVIYYYLDDKRMFRPVLPKQYPAEGVVHYTFEPAQ